MAIIGEAFIAIRPLMTGFGTAVKTGVDSELAGADAFSGLRTTSKSAADDVEKNLKGAGDKAEKDLKGSASRIGSTFENLGESLANWGLPFSGAVGKIGSKIDDAESKTGKFGRSLSTMGGIALGVGAVGAAAVAGEAVHLASGLAEADGQIASHMNISVKAAASIGKAFENSAGTTIFSANEQAEAFAPVSGELAQINGHALTAAQSYQFLAKTGDLAEASGGNLGSTTAAVASIMQGFQVPLSGTTKLTNELFNTSRITGVGVDSLGSTIDRLKARLGVAAPTVGDLSTLLVDLNEHGVQGSRGLQVVNTAVNTLLSSVPKVSAAAATAANSLSDKLTASSESVQAAQTAVSTAQTDGAEKVAKAQQHLAAVQATVAASTTAASPTVAQANSLQAAQTALTDAQTSAAQSAASAQTRLTDAQTKAGEITKTAAVSTNAQVAAMQELGLRVYTTSGKFVGMQSVITQLQPKLAGMTQEQQLATLAQVFGSSASKALLDTVLAGPAAYAKAQKAVDDSSTAHKGAAIQNQNLKRQLDILKASLIDEGDKLGTFLIPKLEDLAKWTENDIRFAEKHKDVVLALAGVIGVALTVVIGAFVINTGAKFLKFLQTAGENVGKLADKVTGSAAKQKLANDDLTANTQKNAELQQKANQTVASSTQEKAATVEASDEAVAGTATSTTATVGTQYELMAADAQTSAGEVVAANEEQQLSFAGVAGDAEAAAAARGGLTAATGAGEAEQLALFGGAGVAGAEAPAAEGLLAKLGLGAGAAGTAAEGTGLGAAAGASSILPAAIAGFVAFKATGDLLHHNVLGIGTAVDKLGNGIAGLFGHSNTQDTKRDEAKDAKLFTKADLPYLAEVVAGTVKNTHGISKNEARDAIKDLGGHASTGGQTTTKLQQQTALLTQLQASARTALAQHGATSAQYLSAEHDLQSTEQKWLPNLSHLQSTANATKQLYIATVALHTDQAKQTGLIAKDGTLAAQKGTLENLRSDLKADKAAGASDATLKDTKAAIATTTTHIDQLKAANAHIAKDSTAISNAQKLKQSIDAVNQGITQLRNQIATTPPPKQKLSGGVKTKWAP